MSYTAAITEFRQMLSDTEYHKKSTKKKLIGDINGDNSVFVTYDKRLLEDTVEVFVNDVSVPFDVTDPVQGFLTLKDAPDINSSVTASYYWTWFIDAELITFLNKGAEQVSQNSPDVPDDAYLMIPPGLKSAALKFAANFATQSLIQFMITRRHSEEFLIEEDGNDDTKFSQTIAAMSKLADSYFKEALTLRDDFYKRQGKRNAPAFGIKLGVNRNYGARR